MMSGSRSDASEHQPPYDDRGAILVFGTSVDGLARGAKVVRSGGWRLGATLPVEEALERLDRQALTGAVLLTIDEESAEAAALLDRLNSESARGRFNSVVASGHDLLDFVAAHTPAGTIEQLIDPDDATYAAALALAAAPRVLAFNDSRRDGDAARLRQLTEDVQRIVLSLSRLAAARVDGGAREVALPAVSPPDVATADSEFIRTVIRGRRLRGQFFDPELFADPAWDMLLDLMAAHLDQQRVAVSSLCIASAAPATTALRWIKTLTDYGLFVRRADPTDGRRVFIELSDSAALGMGAYLAELQRIAAGTPWSAERLAL